MGIPRSEWYWSGYPGHFCAASDCHFFLHTRVGDYRVSTVGDYHPPHLGERSDPQLIGSGRTYETMVFRVKDNGYPEGEVVEYSEIDSMGYNDSRKAEAGHYKFCEKYANTPAEGAE